MLHLGRAEDSQSSWLTKCGQGKIWRGGLFKCPTRRYLLSGLLLSGLLPLIGPRLSLLSSQQHWASQSPRKLPSRHRLLTTLCPKSCSLALATHHRHGNNKSKNDNSSNRGGVACLKRGLPLLLLLAVVVAKRAAAVGPAMMDQAAT